MKKTKSKILIFSFLVVLLLGYLSMVFSYPIKEHTDMTRERFNSYYALPKNTLDGVVIGTSGAGRYWLPANAWHDSGITVYGLTTGNQPLFFIKYYIEEVLKRHNPEFIAIDIRAVLQDPVEIADSDIRRTTDNMRLSRNRIEATRGILEYLSHIEGSTIDTEDPSYYFHLAKYHSSWKDMKLESLVNLFPKSKYMGYLAGRRASFRTLPEFRTTVITETTPIDPRVEPILVDLLDYCETIDTPVIFMSAPFTVNLDYQRKLNYALEMIAARGFDTYNFNTDEMYDALGWDFSTDMYDHGHANYAGAVKFTDYMSQVFIEKYGAKDRRLEPDQSKYKDWNIAYDNTIVRVEHFIPEYYEENYANND